jgi:peptide/nickel transport system substrate-binding protein
MRRRDFLRLSASSVGLLIVAACGPSAQPAPPTSAPAKPAATSAPVAAQPAATSAPAQAAARRGGSLKVGLDVDADSLDPRLARNTSGFRVREVVFNGLVVINADFSPAPDLAESWQNPDEKTYVFKLRPDAKFHDGSTLTSEDVKYTFETILDEKFSSPWRANYTPIDTIETPDPTTVRFSLKTPFGPFLSYMDMGIVSKAAAEKLGKDFGTKPVGTGPFKVDNWATGDSINLSAHETFFQGRANLDRLQVKVVPDNSARVVALESGDLDFVQSPLSPQDVTRTQQAAKLKVERTPAAGFTYVNLNTSDPILADKKVRQALSHLVNKQQLIETIYKGIGQPANGPIVPTMWAYSPDLPSYDYNPDRARQLLDEAGWKPGADGIRARDGMRMELTVRTHTEDPDRRQVIQVMQSEFQKVGIDTKTATTDFPALLNDLMDAKHQLAVVGWLNLSDPDRATFRQFTLDGAGNYGRYKNEQVDKLLKDARATLDRTKAKQLYTDALKQVVDDAPYIFIQYQEYIAMYQPKMQGFALNPVTNWQSFRKVSLS